MTNPMPPTEQDEELQKAVWASLASQMTHAINCTDPEHKRQDSCVDFTKKNFEQLMQLITADRKRVALEARIDELRMIETAQQNTDQWGGFCIDDTSDFLNYIDSRIAELKAQQEEV